MEHSTGAGLEEMGGNAFIGARLSRLHQGRCKRKWLCLLVRISQVGLASRIVLLLLVAAYDTGVNRISAEAG